MTSTQRKRQPRRHCFTLMEIMIVIVIIGMVAGLVGPALMNNLGKAQVKTAKNQTLLLYNACKDYYLDMTRYPDRLDQLITNPGDPKWDGPYLDPPKVPLDPWGEEYQIRTDGTFGIFSKGSDRTMGGTGKGADITSWE